MPLQRPGFLPGLFFCVPGRAQLFGGASSLQARQLELLAGRQVPALSAVEGKPQAKLMEGDLVCQRTEGTPQGGPRTLQLARESTSGYVKVARLPTPPHLRQN